MKTKTIIPAFALEVITPTMPAVTQRETSGWGDEAVKTRIDGFPMEILIRKDGKQQFGFRILEDGQVIITDYGHMCFQNYVEQNFRMYPARPWKPKEKE